MIDRRRLLLNVSACLAIAVGLLLAGGCVRLLPSSWFERPVETFADAIARIDREIDRVARRLDLPGLTFVVFDEQQILWRRDSGWADIESKITVDEETIFRAGSISKVFTAIEIMRLHEERLLDLDAPIEAVLPDFAVQRPFDDASPIAVRSLLTHRSGLPRNGTLPLWYWDPGPAVLRELVASLAAGYASYPPWTRYKYSNIGYCLLGRVIEVLRGRGFPEQMERAIFDPLGMTSSAFLSSRLPRGRTVATGYWPIGSENVASHAYDIITMPSGNLYATSSDLARFGQCILRQGLIEEERLLAPETLAEMFDARYATKHDPQSNGLGWMTDSLFLGERVVFHDGTNDGTISMLALLPERHLGLVAIANSDAFEDAVVELAFEALGWLRQGLFGVNRRPAQEEPSFQIAPDALAAYAATYVVNGEPLRIRLDDGRLTADVLGIPVRLVPISATRFRAHHPLLPLNDVLLTISPEPSKDAIVTLGGSYYIYAPRYPVQASLPEDWQPLLGVYEVHPRHASRYSDADVLWRTEIVFVQGMLSVDGSKQLAPIDARRIRIVGGIFDEEIMDRDPETGIIEWASFRYVPEAAP